MNNFSTRMTSVLLVFGIFFTLSCTSLEKTSKNAETLYYENNYQSALETVNSEISEYPDSTEIKVLKARILKDHAMNDHAPANRDILYSNLRNTVDEVQFSPDAERFTAETDSILKFAWAHEQSEGVRYLQQDESGGFERYFDRVISHFSNAITIIPDSIVTYNLKATTFYRHGDLTKAIETLESIEEKGLNRPAETCEKLAYLYLEAGLIQQSIDIYEGLVANHPDSEIYQQGLVNAYILGDRHYHSVKLLEELTEKYPNRAEYKEALATERFYKLKNSAEELKMESPGEERTQEEIEIFTDSLTGITELYHDVDSTLPASEERKERIAAFHLNAADLLNDLIANTNPEEDSHQIAVSEKQGHLRYAIPYLQELYETNAENLFYARRLIYVYQKLGMEHEAETLERQINL